MAGALYNLHHPDLVITDLLMPEKDGLEVIMDLRCQDKNVRIVAMSGDGQRKPDIDLKMARKLGATRVLSKPFGDTEFLEAVRLTLEPGE